MALPRSVVDVRHRADEAMFEKAGRASRPTRDGQPYRKRTLAMLNRTELE